MAEIVCKNLFLGYKNNILIRNLNFEVNKGDYLCIVGENGCGKSTLMRTILNLQKPLSGTILFDEGLTPSKIGYLPQQTIVQKDFPACVKEVVLSGCQAKLGKHIFYSKKDKECAFENMKQLEILDLSEHCYRYLSGGQQQRVLLARALCATEEMLLLDEPVAGLDPKVTVEMYDIIKKLNDNGITIIMISHDIVSAVKYADYILHIGYDVFYGAVENYKSCPQGKIYLQKSIKDD